MFGHNLNRGYFKGGGGDTQSTNTIQNATPWSGVQPYLSDLLKKGQAVTSQPYQYYSGDQIAPFSPEQLLGMQLTTQRALAGSPLLNAGQTNATDTLSGKYLSPDSNPWFSQTVNRALGDVSGRVNSQFNNDNWGSSANQELLSRNLGDTAAQMWGQNYQNERQNQMNLIPQAAALSQADYLDAAQLENVGAQRQALAQQYLTQGATDFRNAANWPLEQLQAYGNIVSQGTGQGGTTSSTTTGPNPYQQNTAANILGLGATGLGLYNGLTGAGLLGSLASSAPSFTGGITAASLAPYFMGGI